MPPSPWIPEATPTDRAALIPAFVNPLAGGAENVRAALLADPRFEAHEIAPQRTAAVVRAEAARGTRRLLVCGGDGTVGTALGAAVGTTLEVAIFPGGTLNHFARDFGLPLDNPAATLDIAATGVPMPVDLGYVNGHAMLNTSAVGTYVDFVRRREANERWLGYRLASVVAAIAVWIYPRIVSVEFRGDDGTYHRFRTPLLFVGVDERILDHAVGNAGLGGRRPGGAHAFHVLVVNERTRLRVAVLAFGALVRGIDGFVRTDAVDAHLVTDAVAVMRQPTGTVAVDGELVRMASPLRYEFKKDAVTVVGRRP